MSERPNLLLISMDMLRYDAVGANGNPLVRTPNMDRLAAEGMRFERAYASHPVCMPCRASIVTGRYPSSHGVWSNGVPLSEAEITLPAALGRAGYDTFLCGKAHFRPWLSGFGEDRLVTTEHAGDGPYYGFRRAAVVDHSDGDCYSAWVRAAHPAWAERAIHHWSDRPADKPLGWKATYPAEASKTDFIADQTIAAIESHKRDRPFFFWASFIDPHQPFAPPAPFCDWHDGVQFPEPAAIGGPPVEKPSHYHKQARPALARAQWLNLRRMYQGKVSHVDDRIGRILAALDAGGFARDTVVVLFSDHGVMLGEYGIPSGGAKPSDVCSRIPMIWRVPGARRGAVNSGLVSTVDIMPTLLELAGVAAPAGVQGLSLRPLLEDRATRVREDLLMEGGREGERPGAPNLSKTLIAARHKLTLYADPDEAELYDLQDDPHELRNLYTRPEAADLRRELTERLARRIIRSQNPLPLRVAPW